MTQDASSDIETEVSHTDNLLFTDFNIGDIARDERGRVGVVENIEDIGGEKYVRIKVVDRAILVPFDRFTKTFRRTNLENGQTLQEILEEAETLQVREASERILREYVKNHLYYDLKSLGLEFATPEMQTRAAAIIEHARKRLSLFRSDTRPPYGNGVTHSDKEVEKGIFETGFIADYDNRVDYVGRDKPAGKEGVYVTADPHRALEFPIEEQMSDTWDGESFLYVIDFKGVAPHIGGLGGNIIERDHEIQTGNIPKEFIPFAFHRNSNNQVLEIFQNPVAKSAIE